MYPEELRTRTRKEGEWKTEKAERWMSGWKKELEEKEKEERVSVGTMGVS